MGIVDASDVINPRAPSQEKEELLAVKFNTYRTGLPHLRVLGRFVTSPVAWDPYDPFQKTG